MKIISHNVYWFQGSPSRWGRERVAAVEEVFRALADLYAAHEPDLLCLLEVHLARWACAMAERLHLTTWMYFRGGLRKDYGGAILSRGRAELTDHTRADDSFLHERCHARARASFAGGELEIAAVHLPSDRFCGSRQAGEQARLAEIDRILAVEPLPALVTGDFNSTPDSAPYKRMRERGYVDAAVATGAADRPSFRRHRVDYVWIGPAARERLAGFSALEDGPFVRTGAGGETWRLSDHPPLLVELI